MNPLLAAENWWIALVALGLERMLGYPAPVFAAISHPVVWVGALIDWLDRTWNRAEWGPGARRTAGVCAVVLMVLVVAGLTLAATLALRAIPGGWMVEAVLASSLLAQRDLGRSVAAVAGGLDESLAQGRDAVRHIVGRNPTELDESGVAKGAIESLAENTADGIIVPLFWLLIGGLPAIAVYKAINTADSMIGHRSEKYADFGWAAARLDDLVNLPGARLTGALFALAAMLPDPKAGRAAFRAMLRDAPKHVSPNAGWPEASMAGALEIQLGGPRSYGERRVDLPTMGQGRLELSRRDIRAALALYERALWIAFAFVGLGAAFTFFP